MCMTDRDYIKAGNQDPGVEFPARKKVHDMEPLVADVAEDMAICSSTDCTGLIPSLPQSDAELESYQELYPYKVSE